MKIHTKKQIQEAIKHWQNVLNQINESKNALISSLEQIFEKDLCSYDASFNAANTSSYIFDTLNKFVFNGKLSNINIQFLTSSQIQVIFDKYNNPQNPNDLYAVYFPIPDWEYINKTNFQDIKLKDQFFIVNISQGIMNPAFAISTICHEMIHYYDTFYGDILLQAYLHFKKKIQFDEHTTEIFKQKSNEANNMGLTIIPNGSGYPLEELNKLSAYRLNKKINEDEYYDNLFQVLQKQKTNIFDKISITDGNLGSIAF